MTPPGTPSAKATVPLPDAGGGGGVVVHAVKANETAKSSAIVLAPIDLSAELLVGSVRMDDFLSVTWIELGLSLV
jgi:hypothetical protein